MKPTFTEGQTVVSADDHTIGKVVGHRDDCVLVETGHVFKTTHAIPATFLHEHEGQLRATVSKEVVGDSPKVDNDDFDCEVVLRHYGLADDGVIDPDPALDDDTEPPRSQPLPPDPDDARLEVATDDPDTAPLSPYNR
jgi:hypothetical protein